MRIPPRWRWRCLVLIATFAFVSAGGLCRAGGLSPENWPQADREALEQSESGSPFPASARVVTGRAGLISATTSPISIYAGVKALDSGGSAADATAAVALTQVTMELGSVVSYAGVFTMVYYDAKTHHVYSMDAGYNSYREETHPETIPTSKRLRPGAVSAVAPTVGTAYGRMTLVPGFMAGVEAMHRRFGRLDFAALFEPAVWYAEHGVRLSRLQQYYFRDRLPALTRTAEGKAFIRQSGRDAPEEGDTFVQRELAQTLRAVSETGARYMYRGKWADDFVRIVRREGGMVTADDLANYEPIWSEPAHETVFQREVYANGTAQLGGAALFLGLNLAEALQLERHGPYWSDPDTFVALDRIGPVAASVPHFSRTLTDRWSAAGVSVPSDMFATKPFAAAIAPLLLQSVAAPTGSTPHSNAIVVVDGEGNVAAITHTINTVIWGETGIVVDGIPIPDAANFQQAELARIPPGSRVHHHIIDAIVFEKERPILATASIGSSLVPESIRVVAGVLAQRADLATVMREPPLLLAPVYTGHRIPIPAKGYDPAFLSKLKATGVSFEELDPAAAASTRGTLAVVAIDPATGTRSAVEQPGMVVFDRAQ